MKVIITHLKAAWPAGAAVGDVVEIPGDAMPGWAAGKCTLAADDSPAQHVFEPVVLEPLNAPVAATDPDALKAAEAMTAAAREEADELRARVARAEDNLAAVTAERDAAVTERDALKAQLEQAGGDAGGAKSKKS